jgi:four helix bundle protein
MVARFQELVAWQRSVELCDVIFTITETGPASGDREFHDQIRDAAKHAPSLIAEGFARYTTAEFVRYLRMAMGELGEVQSNLELGRRLKYISTNDADRAELIARRAMGTTTNLLKSKLRQLDAETRRKRRRRS